MKVLKNPKAKKGIILLVVLAAAYFVVWPRLQGDTSEIELPAHPNPGPTYTVGPRVYNLTVPAGEPPRFVKLAAVFEFAEEEPAFFLLEGEALHAALESFAEELGPKRPVIEDAVGSTVSAETYEDLATVAGRERLKEELSKAVAVAVGEPELLTVYLTEFVIQ